MIPSTLNLIHLVQLYLQFLWYTCLSVIIITRTIQYADCIFLRTITTIMAITITITIIDFTINVTKFIMMAIFILIIIVSIIIIIIITLLLLSLSPKCFLRNSGLCMVIFTIIGIMTILFATIPLLLMEVMYNNNLQACLQHDASPTPYSCL